MHLLSLVHVEKEQIVQVWEIVPLLVPRITNKDCNIPKSIIPPPLLSFNNPSQLLPPFPPLSSLTFIMATESYAYFPTLHSVPSLPFSSATTDSETRWRERTPSTYPLLFFTLFGTCG